MGKLRHELPTQQKHSRNAILEIRDISVFVAEQRENATREGVGQLIVLLERVYTPAKPKVTERLKLSV